MKYDIIATSRFKRDLKAMLKRNANINLLNDVVDMLAAGAPLPAKYRDHNLSGNWAAHRECHIEPDWLLIYKTERNLLVLTLSHTGTHSDLFDL